MLSWSLSITEMNSSASFITLMEEVESLSASLSTEFNLNSTLFHRRDNALCYSGDVAAVALTMRLMSFIKDLKACTDGSHGTGTPLRES